MTVLDCLECKDLDRVLKLTLASYREARSAPFYRVCTDVAARKEVDMERAKTALHEHQLACPLAIMDESDSAGELAPMRSADSREKVINTELQPKPTIQTP
jgi:hypothetical protein